MEQYKSIWNQVKESLKSENTIDVVAFSDVIDPVTTVYKFDGGFVWLIADTTLIKYRIDKFYLDQINDTLSKILDNNKISPVYKYKIINISDVEKENKEKEALSLNQIDHKEIGSSTRTLRSEYTFQNFVTGNSNRYAFMTALKVAEQPVVSFNPLYIFGEVGLGKTHLMTAVGHYILEKNPNTNIIYTTITQFVEDFGYASAIHKKNPEAFKQFYDKYRCADVLLIDDIQFLANKNATQEEFFKLFEYLFENNKQIVLTSDRHASELDNIMSRLVSRFNWGIAVDITKPDFDHRLAIIKRKLEFLIPNPNVVEEDSLRFIAQNFANNVRDLESALRRFINYCVSFNIPFTLANAQLSLDSIVKPVAGDPLLDKIIQIDKIKKVVAKYFKITVADLTSPSRKKEIVYPRHLAVYLIRTLYDVPLKKIGEHFSNRDHASIAHAFDKISEQLQKDWMIKQDIENISKLLD